MVKNELFKRKIQIMIENIHPLCYTIDEKEEKSMKKTVCLFAAMILLAGCGGSAETKELTGTAESKDQTTTVKVTKEGDKVKSVSIDETYTTEDGEATTKKTLKEDYNMKSASGIGKEWYEQIEFLENYIVENGVDAITLDDSGKATNEDVLAGCTINIQTYIDAYNNAK